MFKVGDKVRCISYGEDSSIRVDFLGVTGEVISVNEDDMYPYRVAFAHRPDDFMGGPLFHEHELELVAEDKPKQYLIRWSDGYTKVTDTLDGWDFDGDTRVWELGDELVKKVTWEKKDVV